MMGRGAVPLQQSQIQPQTEALAALPMQAQRDQSDVAQVEAPSYEIEETLEIIEEKYEFVEEIAQGTFGRLFAARLLEDSTHKRAIKLIKQGHAGEHLFFREVGLLKALSHQHIARFYDVFDYPNLLCVVMEICDGGDLFAKILETNRFSERETAQLGRQMLLALQYIHLRHIAHRGVKAENFMLATPHAPSQLKLVDFFFACEYTPGRFMTEVCGAPHYLAPELIAQKYNCLVDLWAFGVLQFVLMHGRYPFNGKTPCDIMTKIACTPRLWHTRAHVSLTCMDFLQGVLAVRSSSRLSALEALEHVWMHQTDAHEGSEENPEGETHMEHTVPPEALWNAQTPSAHQPPIGPLMAQQPTKQARL